MQKKIKINYDLCRGCRRCEIACSWRQEGSVQLKRAKIKIKVKDQGATELPIFEQQCKIRPCTKETPRCVTACNFGALEFIEGGINND
ncbi:hypothetical protein MWH28_05730 [Natroniella sulfidigena]|uniref:hypothetical protein n=1 Tax=Natroniella sulfidigena TaxID=723921 RepID=UPI00200A58FA|nr:hypothetical protein [Natroniella sulfidigena]MCK8816872.1 hypothetical protein [Natroniella sulfidigena]